MERFILSVDTRSELGSGASRRFRRKDLIPSIIYSHGEPSVPVLLGRKEFEYIGKQVRSSQIFTIKSKDKSIDDRPVIVKEIQRDYVRGGILHIDFQALKENEEITVRIPLRFVGEAPGVKLAGGILTVLVHDMGIVCLPKLIPTQIEVNVGTLGLGDSIHAKELKLPEGVKLDEDPEETVVSVVAPKAMVEETPAAAEAAATAEGAAAQSGEQVAAEGEQKGDKKTEKKPEKDKKE